MGNVCGIKLFRHGLADGLILMMPVAMKTAAYISGSMARPIELHPCSATGLL
jgi:hypothetical protein